MGVGNSEDEKKDKDRPQMEPMMNPGFLSGRDGIFINNDEKDDCVQTIPTKIQDERRK